MSHDVVTTSRDIPDIVDIIRRSMNRWCLIFFRSGTKSRTKKSLGILSTWKNNIICYFFPWGVQGKHIMFYLNTPRKQILSTEGWLTFPRRCDWTHHESATHEYIRNIISGPPCGIPVIKCESLTRSYLSLNWFQIGTTIAARPHSSKSRVLASIAS